VRGNDVSYIPLPIGEAGQHTFWTVDAPLACRGDFVAEKFPGICVIGGGMCGSATALKLVREGIPVTLIDRGSPIGTKNISGGILWGRDLEEVLPRFWEDMPYERSITSKRISLLTDKSGFTIEYKNTEWRRPPYAGFSVLRARVDKWLASKIPELAAEHNVPDVNVIEGVLVEGFTYDDKGHVDGILQGGEEMKFDAYMLCDGANSRLLDETPLVSKEQSALKKGSRKYKMAHQEWGAKVIIQLDEKTVEDRFNLMPGDGVANEMVLGFLPKGIRAGGFMYSNKDTISLGIMLAMESAWRREFYFRDALDQYVRHPYIQPFVLGGLEVEYSTHWAPIGGINWMPKLYDDRLLVGGDTAQMLLATGLNIEGMNYAIKSGLLAGQTFADAWKGGKNFSAAALAAYERRLWNSYVLQDLAQFRNIDHITGNARLFYEYPRLIESIFTKIVWPTGQPKKTFGENIGLTVLNSGIAPQLIGDGAKAALSELIPAAISRAPFVGPLLTKVLVERHKQKALRHLYHEMQKDEAERAMRAVEDKAEPAPPAVPGGHAHAAEAGGGHA
jgi:electron transfer flavoprotein-quinone oxidoreductase